MHEDKRAETPLAMHFWASGLLQQDPDAAIVAEKNQAGRTRTRSIAEGVAQGAWAGWGGRQIYEVREAQIREAQKQRNCPALLSRVLALELAQSGTHVRTVSA